MAKLYFRYGAMGSGKTIDLLKVAYNYEERSQKVLIFTSALDNRYGVGKITTRVGLQREAIAINRDFDIYKYMKDINQKIDCVLVDEANFLTEKQVYQLSDVVDFLNIPVICYGLRSDFRLKFFEGSHPLMELADKIEEIKTICECGAKATVNMRFVDGKAVTTGDQVFIGGNESYKAVCRKCYKKYINYNPK